MEVTSVDRLDPLHNEYEAVHKHTYQLVNIEKRDACRHPISDANIIQNSSIELDRKD